VGGVVSFEFWLSRPLDFGVDIWTETKSPTRDWSASGTGPLTHIRIGTTKRGGVSTGYQTADSIGDWGLRIIGDRLPDGVVLGNPSSVRWSVVP